VPFARKAPLARWFAKGMVADHGKDPAFAAAFFRGKREARIACLRRAVTCRRTSRHSPQG